MEPITQGLLGAAAGHVVAGRTLGRRALVWGALVGMSPDLDVVLAPLDRGFGEWLYHRGTTHSLWFGFVLGPVLGWLLARRARAPDETAAWMRLCVAALVTHPILDGFTPYGTQLFAPFDRTRFAWHGVAIVDPFYTLVLAWGVFVAARASGSSFARRRASVWIALGVSTLYLFFGVGLNVVAKRAAQRAMSEAGRRVDGVTAYPTLLQPFLRRVVVRSEGQIFVGLHTTLRPGCVRFEVFDPPGPDARIDDLMQSAEGRLLRWFALDDTTATLEPLSDGTTLVRLEDLRYAGLAGPPQESMWGVVARYGSDGRRLSSVERFGRDMRDRARVDLLGPALFGEDGPGLALQRCETGGSAPALARGPSGGAPAFMPDRG